MSGGTWALFHPRWALQALRQACNGGTYLKTGEIEVQLDRDSLDRITTVGVSPDWHIAGRIALDGRERIIKASFDLTAPTAPDESLHLSLGLDDFDRPVTIELPSPAHTISLTDYAKEQLGS